MQFYQNFFLTIPLNSSLDSEVAFTAAQDLAERAVKCDVRSDDVQSALGLVLSVSGQTSEALHALQRAVVLNPNNAHGRMHFAMAMMHPDSERSADALLQIRTAMLFSPADPYTWVFHGVACVACM